MWGGVVVETRWARGAYVLVEVVVARVADPHLPLESELRDDRLLCGALRAEDVSAVTTVVLQESEETPPMSAATCDSCQRLA